MKLARRLTRCSQGLFRKVARQSGNQEPTVTGQSQPAGRLTYPGRCVKGGIRNAYASHLERQYQLRAGFHSGGDLPGRARGKAELSAASLQRS